MTHIGGDNVFKKYLFASGVALLSASVAVGAQSSTQSSSSSDQSQSGSSATAQSDTQSSTSTESSAARASSTEPTATLVGCLYREQDIPGRTPNVAERVGVMEDYILADAQPKASSTSADASSSSTAGNNDTTGAVGTSGTVTSGGKMYKLEHVSDEILGALVGKRVEVIGRIDKEPGDQTSTQGGAAVAQDNSAGPDRIELAEFEVTSIQATAGTCPARPSSAR
jgi:hypothetical protein